MVRQRIYCNITTECLCSGLRLEVYFNPSHGINNSKLPIDRFAQLPLQQQAWWILRSDTAEFPASSIVTAMSIARFTGPLTADKISEWMSKCEEIFKKFDDAHPTQKMPSRRKIQEAVACLSDSHAASKALSKWYTQNRDTLDTEDWDTFRDELLKHALSTAE